MNTALMIGRLTKNPTVKTVDIKGVQTKVCNFFIGVDDGFGEYQKTDFIHVTAWRGLAEAIAKNCAKGREMAVLGAVHLESWAAKDDKGNPTMRTSMAIARPLTIEFLGTKNVGDQDVEVTAEATAVEEADLPWTDQD